MNLTSSIDKITDEEGNRIVNTLTEDMALTAELTYKPSGTRIDAFGNRIYDQGRLWGFDVNTASYGKLLSYFTDARVTTRSQSLITFVLRKIAVRFPREFSHDRTKIAKIVGMEEHQLIESEARNDQAWFGEVGFQNMVRLDKSLNIKSVKIIKKSNDRIIIT